MGFSESFEAAGVQHGTKVLYKGRNHNPEEKIKAQLKTGEVWELKRLPFADGNLLTSNIPIFQSKSESRLVNKKISIKY
ncbi:hypothetical protein [Bacillus oleivorans]|uniref:hypothetical protein n=1 Tax=Bacillus oleivorans TaxID=1448271 RepID=UPI000BE3C54E|nr:hypothetical protein [Bacillus oleivorans]